jgi:hypothetical protein
MLKKARAEADFQRLEREYKSSGHKPSAYDSLTKQIAELNNGIEASKMLQQARHCAFFQVHANMPACVR